MKKMLVPCDFSAASENALNYALELAHYFSARLVLLNVSMYPVLSPEMNMPAYSFEEMKQDGLQALHKLSEKIKSRHPAISEIECYAELGDVATTVKEYAEKVNADLTVMGITHQESGLLKTLIGSNAIDVSKEIKTPLIIVPQHVAYKKIRNIAYACDYDANIESSLALARVKYLATLFNSLLHVLHIIPEGHDLSPKEAAVDDYIEHQLINTEHKTYLLKDSKVSDAIIDFLNEHKIDLVIAEPKGHSIFHSSITKQIAYNCPVPLLIIHG